MKKILILLGLIILTGTMAQAGNCDNFSCPANPYSNSFSFSNLIGTNFIAEKIGNAVIKKAIKKESQGKYKVDLQSYNLTALKKGIFKSLVIEGKDTVTDDIYVSTVKFKSLCDYNYIDVNNKDNTVTFMEPFAMAFALQITGDDLNKTMESKSYTELIRRVNSIGNTSKLFNIVSTTAKIENNRLYYVMSVGIPFIKNKQDITIETDFKVRNGEIALNDTKLVTSVYKFDISKLEKIINYLNPLEFSMGILENHDVKTQIKEVSIKDNKIDITGIFTIEKGYVTEQ